MIVDNGTGDIITGYPTPEQKLPLVRVLRGEGSVAEIGRRHRVSGGTPASYRFAFEAIEHLLPKQRVVGSNHVRRSLRFSTFSRTSPPRSIAPSTMLWGAKTSSAKIGSMITAVRVGLAMLMRACVDWRAGLRARLADRVDLLLENLALRHQIMVYERGRRLRGSDRLCWCMLARFWRGWREPLTLVQPATVLCWRRTPWWRHLRRRRSRRGGRPPIAPELQALIQRMAKENPRWGSMRILGALRLLGFKVSDSTVRRYRPAVRRPPPGQSWTTFLHNHVPYLREALRDELSQRTRRLLETLLQLRPAGRKTIRQPLGEWQSELPSEYLELIEERWGQWLCRCPSCQRGPPAARDSPSLRRDAA